MGGGQEEEVILFEGIGIARLAGLGRWLGEAGTDWSLKIPGGKEDITGFLL